MDFKGWGQEEAVLHIRLYCTPALPSSLWRSDNGLRQWRPWTRSITWRSKLLIRLRNVVLREDVFRKCGSFSDVDSLRSYCTAFKAALKDADLDFGGQIDGRESDSAATTDPLPGVGDVPEEAPTSSNPSSKPRKCGSCGRTYLPRKSACPAEKLVYYNCSKVGHLAVLCRQGKKSSTCGGRRVSWWPPQVK
ncbi:hypothetical protein E2C01_054176 [Portunus trituberculatus]|uniref:CCHC-type domain-containing protein n=1 Tax=Portunus trituberculatus TaxID=210409 RepID=A0A5B7GT09_PORTR|nr:hypothetical protein [Portunus trituberculatus]